MATKDAANAASETDDLLRKLLVVQLHSLGTKQDTIARVVGKGKLWVNDLLKGVPKAKKNREDE